MMYHTIMAIMGVALGILLVGDLLLIVARLRWYYWTVPRLRPIDQSRLNISPVDGLKPIVAALGGQGFTRLGEAGLPQGARLSGPVQIWYFVDSTKTTFAVTFITDRAHAIIYSWFGSEAVVITAYPVGDHIEQPNYRYTTISTSVADAYRHHLAQTADFQIRYGDPMHFESMATVLELDRQYNQKFSRRRKGRSSLWHLVGTSVFQLYLISVVLGTVIIMQRFHPPAGDTMTAMFALLVAGGGLYWIARQHWG